MISIEMSPCQFAKVSDIITHEHPEATLQAGDDKPAVLGSNKDLVIKTGHIHTSQIDADFEYRPRENNQGTLVFLNEQKHGMYKMVSDDTIGAHLGKLLSGIVCDEAPVKPTEPVSTTPPATGVTSFVKLPVQGTN